MTDHTTDQAPEEPRVPLSERMRYVSKSWAPLYERRAVAAWADEVQALEARNRHLADALGRIEREETVPGGAGVIRSSSAKIAAAALRTLDSSEGE